MELNNIILNSLLLFALFSFFINFFTLKLSQGQNNILLDRDFLKPQAYHKKAVPRSGGLAAIISCPQILQVNLHRGALCKVQRVRPSTRML